jgi:hypothetical protein
MAVATAYDYAIVPVKEFLEKPMRHDVDFDSSVVAGCYLRKMGALEAETVCRWLESNYREVAAEIQKTYPHRWAK